MTPADLVRHAQEAHAARRYAEAEDSYRAALALAPEHPGLHFELAQVLAALGRHEEAAQMLRRAIALRNPFPEAWNLLGVVCADLNRLDEAVDSLRQAVAQRPAYPRAWNNLGKILQQTGQLETASRAIEQAIAGQPDYALAHFNLGSIQRELGHDQAAEAALARATELAPDNRRFLLARASVQRALGRWDEAARAYARAIQLAPGDSAEEYASLAGVLGDRGDTSRALEVFRQGQAHFPRHVRLALGARLTLPSIADSAEEIAESRARFERGAGELADLLPKLVKGEKAEAALEGLKWQNFYLAYQGGDDLPLQSAFADAIAAAVDAVAPELREPLPGHRHSPRLRIGFLSNFFTVSTVGMYFQSWITQLDRSRFEVNLYHLAAGMNPVAETLRQHADRFLHLGGRQQRVLGVAQTLRAEALDLLVYPELGMDAACFLLAAMRLAPVQMCGWGHPVTTGHQTMDAFFTSDVMETAEAGAHYREKLLRLPGIGTAYPRPDAPGTAGMPPQRSRRELGLPEDRTLYLCSQAAFKIHPDADALLARAVCADPRGTLVLFEARHPAVTDRLMKRLSRAFAALGEDVRARSLVLPFMSRADYLQVNGAMDLMLDTLHWSGGNTSLDALACGLPAVTLPGRFMRGCQTAGMLTLLGVPGLVAQDADDYLRIAAAVAADRDFRHALSTRIRAALPRLFEDPEPVRAMQDVYADWALRDR
jgi:CRISPR-associated protein Csy1